MQCMFTEFFIVATSANFQKGTVEAFGNIGSKWKAKILTCATCHLIPGQTLPSIFWIISLFFKLLHTFNSFNSIVRKFDPNLELYNGIKAKMQTIAALEALATKEKQDYYTYEYFPIYSYNEHDIS